MELNGRKVAVLAADDYEDLELWYPYYRMKEAGAEVKVVDGNLITSRTPVDLPAFAREIIRVLE